MFGFDSLSRNAFMRKLPKSYEYLTKILKADVLKGYNIVGDGTPQALIPLLTGFTELELPEARKRKFSSTYVNSYPFIWKEYQKAGYVRSLSLKKTLKIIISDFKATAFNEDEPKIGTFSYRLNGFSKEPPTDHYMRTYYLAIENDLSNYKKLCVGSVPKHKVMLEYTKDFIGKLAIFDFH